MGWTAQVKHRALFRARRAAGCLVTTFILVGNDWTNSTLLVSECHFFSRVSSTCLVDAAQCCGMAAGGLEAQSKTFERYLILTMSRWKRIFFFFLTENKQVLEWPPQGRKWLDTFKVELDWVLGRLYTVVLPSKVGPDDAWGPLLYLVFCDNVLLQWNCWSRINLQRENT